MTPPLDPLHFILGGASVLGTGLVSIVAWFTVRLISKVEARLDLHDGRITTVEQSVAVLRDRSERG